MSSAQQALTLPGTAALQRTATGAVGRELDRMLAGLNGPQRRGRRARGRAAAHRGRRGLGQDPRAHPPDRLPAGRPHVQPGEILAITFTNKAAGEMKERVAQLVGPRARAMWVSTFHSMCVRILRAEAAKLGLKSSFTIYDQGDSVRLMTMVARDLDLDAKRYPGRSLAAQVSNLKNELVDEESYVPQTAPEKVLAEAYRLYQRRLRQAHAHGLRRPDHDHRAPAAGVPRRRRALPAPLPPRAGRRVPGHQPRPVRAGPRAGRRRRAARCRRPSCAWSATPTSRSTPSAAPRSATSTSSSATTRDATTILLEQNYRSTQRILKAANAVIANNTGRRPKNLWTDSGDGELIAGYVADNEHDEAAWVAEQIDALVDEGVAQPKDIAVFYRTNNASRVFEEVFIRVGMPYKVVGGVRFYERKEVRDALAYLRVVANPADVVSLRRIINTPKRGIGDRAEACIENFADRERIAFASRAAPLLGGPRARHPLAEGDRRSSSRCWRSSSSWSRPVPARPRCSRASSTAPATSPSCSEHRPAGRGPRRQPQRAHLGGRRVRGGQPGRHGHRLPRAGLPGRRRRPDPGHRGRRRRGHADDAAHRQGPGVPGRLPHRPRGRRLPAPAGARRPAGAGGGAPAGLRRHHPGAAAAVPLPRARCAPAGASRPTTRRRGSSTSYPPTPCTGRGWSRRRRPAGTRSAQQRVAATGLSTGGLRGGAGNRAVISVDVGDRVSHDAFGLGTVVEVTGVGDKAQATVDFGSGGTKRLVLRYAPLVKL